MLKKIIFRNTKFQWNLVVLKKTREKKEEYQKLFSPMEPIFGSFWRKFEKPFFMPLPSYPFLEMENVATSFYVFQAHFFSSSEQTSPFLSQLIDPEGS